MATVYEHIQLLSNKNYKFFPFLAANLEMVDYERLSLLRAASLVGLGSIQIKMILHHHMLLSRQIDPSKSCECETGKRFVSAIQQAATC